MWQVVLKGGADSAEDTAMVVDAPVPTMVSDRLISLDFWGRCKTSLG